MAPRKSRRSRRTSRKSRRTSRRQRGGADIVLKCTLGSDNKVQVTAPAGITVDTSKQNTLVMTSTAAVNDIKFSSTAANKAVNPRSLGTGAGIMIQQAGTSLVPASFSAVRALVGTQKRLSSATPAAANGAITITNLNTANLGLSAADRTFTITVTTP